MRHPSKIGAVASSITRLFVTKKRSNTFITHKDEYYKNYWVDKQVDDGITFIALTQRISKKNALELMAKKGMESYIALLYKQYIENEMKPRLPGQKIYRDRFGRLLRRRAKEKGVDVSKLI